MCPVHNRSLFPQFIPPQGTGAPMVGAGAFRGAMAVAPSSALASALVPMGAAVSMVPRDPMAFAADAFVADYGEVITALQLAAARTPQAAHYLFAPSGPSVPPARDEGPADPDAMRASGADTHRPSLRAMLAGMLTFKKVPVEVARGVIADLILMMPDRADDILTAAIQLISRGHAPGVILAFFVDLQERANESSEGAFERWVAFLKKGYSMEDVLALVEGRSETEVRQLACLLGKGFERDGAHRIIRTFETAEIDTLLAMMNRELTAESASVFLKDVGKLGREHRGAVFGLLQRAMDMGLVSDVRAFAEFLDDPARPGDRLDRSGTASAIAFLDEMVRAGTPLDVAIDLYKRTEKRFGETTPSVVQALPRAMSELTRRHHNLESAFEFLTELADRIDYPLVLGSAFGAFPGLLDLGFGPKGATDLMVSRVEEPDVDGDDEKVREVLDGLPKTVSDLVARKLTVREVAEIFGEMDSRAKGTTHLLIPILPRLLDTGIDADSAMEFLIDVAGALTSNDGLSDAWSRAEYVEEVLEPLPEALSVLIANGADPRKALSAMASIPERLKNAGSMAAALHVLAKLPTSARDPEAAADLVIQMVLSMNVDDPDTEVIVLNALPGTFETLMNSGLTADEASLYIEQLGGEAGSYTSEVLESLTSLLAKGLDPVNAARVYAGISDDLRRGKWSRSGGRRIESAEVFRTLLSELRQEDLAGDHPGALELARDILDERFPRE